MSVRRLPPGAALIAISLFAVAVRLAWQLGTDFYGRPEVWEYDVLARNVLNGRGYVIDFLGTEWHTFATPVYPFMLVALHIVGGGADAYGAIAFSQLAMSAAIVPVSYAIARRLGGHQVGLIAAAIIAVHPGLILYTAKVHELVFVTLLGACGLLLAIRARESRTRSGAVLAGLAAGITWLARPTIGLFALASLLTIPGWRRLLLAGTVALAVTVPWSVRNMIVAGGVGTPLNCISLWIGNSPLSAGGALTSGGDSVVRAMPADVAQRVVGRAEAEQGRVFCEEAARHIVQDPVRTLMWWGQKLWFFWWLGPEAGRWYPARWIEAYRLLAALEVTLVLIGAGVAVRRSNRAFLRLVVAQLAIVSIAQSLFYVEGRHRLMLEPALAALAAMSLAALGRGPVARALGIICPNVDQTMLVLGPPRDGPARSMR